MVEATLKERFALLLEFYIGCTLNRPNLVPLYYKLVEIQQQLNQPMRVAIVGLIKAGKSTLMNALLGEKLVATGSVEATFNVNWFKYGNEKSLRVHYKDNRLPESKSFEQLEALTLRADENRELLLSIEYIEVFHPNPILRVLNLIDTPGLASYFADDSENTMNFLKLHGEKLSEVTRAEAAKADAVLYLFDKSLSEFSKNIMTLFQGSVMGQTNPFNAIGVLTKADAYAEDGFDPIGKGLAIAQRLQSDHLFLQNLFYTIRPVCGLLALGAQTLSTTEFEILQKLTKLPSDRFDKLIKDATRFCSKEYPDEPNIPPASSRKLVFDKLDRYGIRRSYALLESRNSSPEKLAQQLLESSGIPELRNIIISHFGNRADLIKINKGLQSLKAACFNALQSLTGADRQIVADMAREFEKLSAGEHSFSELRVLKKYYDNQLNLTEDERQQLLQVTGEKGTSFPERLGFDVSASTEKMIATAKQRIQQWRQLANDFGADSQTIDCANVIVRSYEQVLSNLRHGI